MNDKFLHQKRALQRFTLAQTAFRQARALCEHMEKLKLGPHEEIASAMMAGIVVSYVRPFVRNDGIGHLPKRYSEFEKGSPFESIHKTMLEARHWVYAHRDNQNAPNLGGGNVSQDVVSEVILTLRRDGYSVSINEPQISAKQLVYFQALCSFQHNQINEEVGDLIISIMDEHKIGPGVYEIRDDIKKIS
jgi:hypothetical protein